jgi:hypothetical protein
VKKLIARLFSAGTIANGKDCKQCSASSFNQLTGSMKCIECKPGSFNQNKSSSSLQQCVPCPKAVIIMNMERMFTKSIQVIRTVQ